MQQLKETKLFGTKHNALDYKFVLFNFVCTPIHPPGVVTSGLFCLTFVSGTKTEEGTKTKNGNGKGKSPFSQFCYRVPD